MRYYIDGYNLMFRQSARNLSFSDQREMTLFLMRRHVSQLRLKITIVFDAYQTAEEELLHHLGDLEVRYTAEGQTADEWIIETLANKISCAQITVVTSDRELALRARHKGAHILSVQAFNAWLEKKCRYKSKPAKLQIKSPLVASAPAKPETDAAPLQSAKVSECFEYYLKMFADEENVSSAPVQKNSQPVLKDELPPSSILSKEEDELEYYLRIFEERLTSRDKKH